MCANVRSSPIFSVGAAVLVETKQNADGQVTHPHVVELLGAGFTPEGRRFILLEHRPEGTLGTFHALSAREEMRGPSAYR